jgi:hypothetical protein
MVLVLVTVVGFLVGYRFEMTRVGYVTLALTALGSSVVQVIHLLTSHSREAMTLLPLIVGFVLVLFMLLGALIRLLVPRLPFCNS